MAEKKTSKFDGLFCCVLDCENQELSRSIGISNHSFPSNDDVRKCWIRAVRNPTITEDIPYSEIKKIRVCGKHFKPSDYEVDTKFMLAPHLYKEKKLLKKTAVPSICLPITAVPQLSSNVKEISLDEASIISQTSSPQRIQKRKPEATVTSGALHSHITPLKHRRTQELASSPLSSPPKEFSSPGWLADSSAGGLSSSDSTDSDASGVPNRRFIVDIKCMEELFKRCQLCGEGITEKSSVTKGAQVCISWECVKGHVGKWKSCPDIRQMPEINLLSAASTLYSGGSFSSIARFFEYLNVEFMSRTTFSSIQKTYLLPVLDNYYKEKNDEVVGELILKSLEDQPVSILGDGRSDSPGFSAKYTTYSTMEEETEHIVDFQLVQVSEASSSVAMEKEGFKRSMEFLAGNGINIASVTTDRSPSIIKFMREEYPDIVHQFDVWHVCKGIKKKMCAAGKKKGNDLLLNWTKSITNHFWYACATCDGSYEQLKKIWFSVLNHVLDVHEWKENGVECKCGHDDLSTEKRQKTKWFEKDSTQYKLLSNIVKDKRLTKDMEKLTLFKHTGSLESYHNMMLKYVPKRIHFHHAAMQGRTQLAVLDHNANVGRQQAVTKTKKPRYNIVGRKQDKGSFKARKVFEPKTYPYIKDLMDATIKRRQDVNIKLNDPAFYVNIRQLPKNVYSVPLPPREEVIRQSERIAKRRV